MVHVSEEFQLPVAALGSDFILKWSRKFLDCHRPLLLHILCRAVGGGKGRSEGGIG